MPTLTIHQDGRTHPFAFTGTPTLGAALLAAGFAVMQPCGGRGTCGQCSVLSLTGAVCPPTPAELRAGVRLACQAVLLGDATVALQPHQPWTAIETATPTAAKQPSAARKAIFAGAAAPFQANQTAAWHAADGIRQPLTGNDQAAIATPQAAEGLPPAGIATSMPTAHLAGTQPNPSAAAAPSGASDERMPMPGAYGAAIDLGTTTLVARVYDLRTGALLGEHAAVNPQAAIAADVMGRISYALAGGLATLRDLAQGAIRAAVANACRAAGIAGVQAQVVAGNTVMLYLLTGRDPAALATAPFVPDTLFGNTLLLDGVPTYLPPCAGAFMGADLTCAAMATGLCDAPGTALLCDIGTNGELMLWHAGLLHAASAPAGPAFEGGQISQGVGGIMGAIDRVWVEGAALGVHMLGGGKPVGVCGSGLIDAVAAFLQLGRINASGAADAPSLPLAEGIALTAGDVRAVQLAKAAMAAGIRMLLRAAGAQQADVRQVLLAGGFGSHLSVASAAAIGLIPYALAPRTRAVGNASLAGAALLLLDSGRRAQAERIAAQAKVLQLGGDEAFEGMFLQEIGFPAAEEGDGE
ncbi:MAG: ASKHA domain-containing protein [Candidatus Limiplasma sp.]|nr:ASKHA domain-containing protein [Candidatus Limiplasma sp.]MEA5146311.1 ASKHA domain-containing protein [Candidatus Limiplasma sp.]